MNTRLLDIENQICELLVKVADTPAAQMDRNVSFDSIGLDSLSKVGLINDLSKRLNIKLDAEIGLEYGTPKSLAAYISSTMKDFSSSQSESVTALSQKDYINHFLDRNRRYLDLRNSGYDYFGTP